PEPAERTPAPELEPTGPIPVAEPGPPPRSPTDRPKMEPQVMVPRHQLAQLEATLRQFGTRLATLELRMSALEGQAAILGNVRDEVIGIKAEQTQLHELSQAIHTLVAGLAARLPFAR